MDGVRKSIRSIRVTDGLECVTVEVNLHGLLVIELFYLFGVVFLSSCDSCVNEASYYVPCRAHSVIYVYGICLCAQMITVFLNDL